MHLEHSTLEYIWERYFNGQITVEEREQLLRWVAAKENEEMLCNKVEDVYRQLEAGSIEVLRKQDYFDAERIFTGIVKPGEFAPVVLLSPRAKMKRSWRIAAAAVVFGLLVFSLWIVVGGVKERATAGAEIPKTKDVEPGKNGGILTLANGQTIVLDDAMDGKITDAATKHGSTISYQDAGNIEVEYNTMSTPKGRQFSLVLADGTKVWLNAASSITYPTAFVESDRKVKVSGEAYFEVAHEAEKPFYVIVNGLEVKVLGTHFNVNAYHDEKDVKVTLVEGSVRVSADRESAMLRPGEQAIASEHEKLRTTDGVDVDAVIAWKNGVFQFSDASMKQVIRQIQRWYDVEVEYQGNIPERIFEGKISRQSNLSQVLQILQESGIHFEIVNRKLIVKP